MKSTGRFGGGEDQAWRDFERAQRCYAYFHKVQVRGMAETFAKQWQKMRTKGKEID